MSTTEQPSLQTPVIDEQHPWLGLLTFKEEHHRFFFGRDAEIAEIIDRIKNNTLTILFGQSGLGKSSMLGAGVVRKLGSSGFAPILMRLDHAPGALSLLAQTREGLRKAMPAAPFPARDGSLWEFVHRSFPAGSASETTPVLIFDQFEEIFTLAKQNPEREAEAERWQEEIADLLQDRPPRELEERLSNEPDLWREYDFGRCPLRIVISMREDYLSHLEGLKAKLPLVTRNRMGLQLLNGPQALDAVYGPGALGSQELVSKEVAAIIVRTVAKVPPGTPLEQIKAVPPLLSLLSEQLNEDRISQGKKVITANMVTDQSDDILQRFYEESFSGIKEANREVVRELVEERMITVGGHRHPVALEDAEAELREQGVVDAATVLAKLVERRLLTSEEHRGIQRLEVTHDVLAPLVVRGRKQRQHRQAEVKARKRLTKRFFIAVYAVIPMLLVAAVIFAGKAIRESAKANKAATKAQEQSQVALMQRERALNAEQEQRHLLVQASYSDQETAIRLRTVGDAQEAMAYSERAVLFADENRSALTQAVAAALFDDVEVQRHAWRFPGAVVAMSPSRDPNNLVVLSADRTLRHLNTITGEQLWSTTLKESPHLLATTASNDIVVVGMDNGHVSALDLKSREMLWTSTLIGRIRSMAISYDGKTLFVGSTHGEIVAFDLEHGRKMWSDSNESSVTSVASAEGAVAYASGEGFIYFLSIGGLPEHSGKIKLRFGVTKIAYTAEGDLVAGLEDGSLVGIDVEELKIKWEKNFEGSGTQFILGADRRSAVVTVDAKREGFKLYLVDTTTGGFDERLFPVEVESHTAAITEDCSRLCYHADGIMAVSDFIQDQTRKGVKAGESPSACLFLNGSAWLALGGKDGALRIMDISATKWSWALYYTPSSFATTQDSNLVAASTSDGTVRSHDAKDGSILWEAKMENGYYRLDYSPDGKILAASSTGSGPFESVVSLFDSRSGRSILKHDFSARISRLLFNQDGTMLVARLHDSVVGISIPDGSERFRFAVSSNSDLLAMEQGDWAVSSDSNQKNLTIHYDLSGTHREFMFSEQDSICALDVGSHGQRFAAGTERGQLFVISADGSKKITHAVGSKPERILFSPDGKLLAIRSAGEFSVLDVESGQLLLTQKVDGVLGAMRFMSRGAFLVTETSNLISTFDLSSGKAVWTTTSNVEVEGEIDLPGILTSPDEAFLCHVEWDGLKFFDLRFLKKDFSEDDAAIRDLLQYQCGLTLDARGSLQRLSNAEWTEAREGFRSAIRESPDSSLGEAVRWNYADPRFRTLSMDSEASLYDNVSLALKSTEGEWVAKLAGRRCPGHSLYPVALARFTRNLSLRSYLCNLTYGRLKEEASWRDQYLTAKDAAVASRWMADSDVDDVALNTARMSLETLETADALSVTARFAPEDQRLRLLVELTGRDDATDVDFLLATEVARTLGNKSEEARILATGLERFHTSLGLKKRQAVRLAATEEWRQAIPLLEEVVNRRDVLGSEDLNPLLLSLLLREDRSGEAAELFKSLVVQDDQWEDEERISRIEDQGIRTAMLKLLRDYRNSLAAEVSEEDVPEPNTPRIKMVVIEVQTSVGDFVETHGLSIQKLNALNGLNLNSSTILAKGSELYVPANP